MPIRLNLLAETQAEEELRRRDPVKRAIWGGGALVGCVLLYYVVLLGETLVKRSTLNRMENEQKSQLAQFQKITDNEKQLASVNRTLGELTRLATNRFLWGSVLNALQASVVEDVQYTSFRSEQVYYLNEGTKATRDEASGRVTPAKPAFVTQRIVLTIDAKDTSSNPGDQINKLKTALAAAPFFGDDGTNKNSVTIKLKNLSAPSLDTESGRQAMFFGFDCLFPDKVIK